MIAAEIPIRKEKGEKVLIVDRGKGGDSMCQRDERVCQGICKNENLHLRVA